MNLNIFRKKVQRHSVRDANGQFSPAGSDGSPGSVRKGLRDIDALVEAFGKMNELQKGYYEMEAAKSEAIRSQAQVLAEAMSGNSDSDNSESMFLELLSNAVLLQKQNPSGGTPISPTPPSPEVQTPEEKPAEKLNGILASIAKVPQKLVTKGMISKICKEAGIDEKNLKAAIQKLSRVKG